MYKDYVSDKFTIRFLYTYTQKYCVKLLHANIPLIFTMNQQNSQQKILLSLSYIRRRDITWISKAFRWMSNYRYARQTKHGLATETGPLIL